MLHSFGLRTILIGAVLVMLGACAHHPKERSQSTILFDTGSSELNYNAGVKLSELAKYLRWRRSYHVILKGHADSVGSDVDNLKLSERRAAAVRNSLVSLGVAPERIETLAYGETLPAVGNESAGGRSLNRRVQVTLIPYRHGLFAHSHDH